MESSDKREVFEMELGGIKLPLVQPEPLRLTVYPDNRLRTKAEPVDLSLLDTEEFQELVAKMCFTMYHNGGIGLAANQVGCPLAFFVFDVRWPEEKKFRPGLIVNPRIVEQDTPTTCHEGCLSVGSDTRATIPRFNYVELECFDIHGKQMRLVASGLEAACFQHETDHLNGKLFIDHMSRLRRDMVLRRRAKLRRHAKQRAQAMQKGK